MTTPARSFPAIRLQHDRPAPPMVIIPPGPRPRGWRRWVVYQRERFPVFAHGALIAAFSTGAVCYSAQLREGLGRLPDPRSVAVAFVSCFLFFLQLRIADEFKDFEDDARHRPYRPVPRGLVRLRELGILGGLAVAVQVGLALWLAPPLLLPLALVLGYMALMSAEFFARDWLRGRAITVLWTHMLVIPLIDLYATACDWLAAGDRKGVGAGIAWFLVTSFCNGIVVEIGRKIRVPLDEEPGVDTYSALWGRTTAVVAWLGAMAATAGAAALTAREVGTMVPVTALLGAIMLVAVAAGVWLIRRPRQGRGQRLELISGVWTLAVYLGIGLLPIALHRLAQ
ncbi:MAG TPA: UbiA family prenyltransferase [Gemmatimonadaceae bacterium]|nr:UbiA family prenyltransferase [Gemmatimonadaceae bacterium]